MKAFVANVIFFVVILVGMIVGEPLEIDYTLTWRNFVALSIPVWIGGYIGYYIGWNVGHCAG